MKPDGPAGADASAHFVADVHLADGRPETCDAFFAYLEGPARQCASLYLLGDIFDAWIGDDDDSELAAQTRSRLQALTSAGTAVRFIFGNRDFMVGRRFARATGVELLGEQAVVQAAGRRCLLLHGDTLCTADQAYQRARRRYTDPRFLFFARRLPRFYRRYRARQMVAAAAAARGATADPAVDEALVASLLEKHAAQAVIHGHTHRPAVHQVEGGERWVLPAWPGGGGAGGWLVADDKGLRLEQA